MPATSSRRASTKSSRTASPASEPRADAYARITSAIVAALETGVRPWCKPWKAGHVAGPIARPLRFTGEPYKGINTLMLWLTAEMQGFNAPIWLTFQQAKVAGGSVKAGSKGTTVVYYGSGSKVEEVKDESGAATGETVSRGFSFAKSYAVFNVEQVAGLPAHYYATHEPTINEAARIERADTFFGHTGSTVRHGGNTACYSPKPIDVINIPSFKSFTNPEGYYSTLAHEHIHWTGHDERLGRELKAFGNKNKDAYAKEELIAEIGSAFLCCDLEITDGPREDHVAYVDSWLKILKGDNRAIFTAAGAAQKAVDYLHAKQPAAKAE